VNTGKLVLLKAPNSPDLRYYIQFTLARLTNGFFKTLEFSEGTEISEMPPLSLEPGTYRLVTGNRQPDGSVLSQLTTFQVKAGSEVRVPVTFRNTPAESALLGNLDPAVLHVLPDGKQEGVNLSAVTGNMDYVLVLYDPDKEPSKHVLSEIASYGSHFEKWKGTLVFAVAAGSSESRTDFSLPRNRIQGKDADGSLLKSLQVLVSEDLSEQLPLVVFITPQGKVLYFSAGYRIGIGEQLLRMTR
jgi:hypothetical protein